MKRTVVIILGIIVSSAVLLGSRSLDRREPRPTLPEATTVTPADDDGADPLVFKKRQGVGWVFGRMIGVAQAPGNPNNSPFSNSRRWAGQGI